MKRLFSKLEIMKKLREYRGRMNNNHPFREFKTIEYGNNREDPYEFFDQYDTFSFWVADNLENSKDRLRILDVGGKKLLNSILSIRHDVSSIVLKDCGDGISKVKYTIHDISKPLPFKDKTFDVFTSPGTLHLAGLGRYGDTLDPNVLPNVVNELNRVMTDRSELYLLFPLGKNHLLFNLHYIFEFDTIKDLFSEWDIVEYFVDEHVHFNSSCRIPSTRFSQNTDVSNYQIGEYKIIYIKLKR